MLPLPLTLAGRAGRLAACPETVFSRGSRRGPGSPPWPSRPGSPAPCCAAPGTTSSTPCGRPAARGRGCWRRCASTRGRRCSTPPSSSSPARACPPWRPPAPWPSWRAWGPCSSPPWRRAGRWGPPRGGGAACSSPSTPSPWPGPARAAATPSSCWLRPGAGNASSGCAPPAAAPRGWRPPWRWRAGATVSGSSWPARSRPAPSASLRPLGAGPSAPSRRASPPSCPGSP